MSEEKTTVGAGDPGFLRKLESVDHAAFMFLYNGIKNPLFDAVMPVLSTIANRGILQTTVGAIMIIVGLATHDSLLPKAAAGMWAATMAAGVIAEGTFKMVWKRRRPFKRLEGVTPRVKDRRLQKRPSFPSGHAAGYMATAVSLSMFYPAQTPFFIIAGFLGGFSRIYNGVHFPSDVIAGMMIGAAFGFAAPSAVDFLWALY